MAALSAEVSGLIRGRKVGEMGVPGLFQKVFSVSLCFSLAMEGKKSVWGVEGCAVFMSEGYHGLY